MRVNVLIPAAAGALICAVIAAACSQSPVAPSREILQSTVNGAPIGPESQVTTESAGLSLEDVAARGWDCRPAPTIPNRVTCVPPNVGHPVLLPGPPPPPDRPATFTLLVFDNGALFGTDLLIRSDLYHDQPCRSTGEPYRLIARIGYYECVHPVNG